MRDIPSPWLWQIVDTTAGTVVQSGVQHTRPYATPAEVARERMACHAYPLLRAGQAGNITCLAGLVCRVWRDSERRWGEASGAEWLPVETRTEMQRAG